ncbi:MAG: hypothetical protein Hyperionvirus18_35 [Hyperionvirus sp.]|uniref:Serpin domain-containing protein n=1 Tax=Hyperionvirus sp. TaxID=2487770 RepID=A0A3G5AFK3_9VIRU|nr:MAG: hypothetical protein Hyperionvirus18_35 [Hyperionvirus sp.]
MAYKVLVVVMIILVVWGLVILSCGQDFDSLGPVLRGGEFVTKTDTQIMDVLNREMPKNFLFSPRSLREALAVLYRGASGSTKTTYENYFQRRGAQDMIDWYQVNDRKLIVSGSVKIANSIWHTDKINLSGNYVASISKICEIHEGAIVQKDVNGWVSKKTDGLITSVPIDREAVFIIINALYFHDKWLKPFDSRRTEKEQFYLSKAANDFVFVPMMVNEIYMDYFTDDGYSAVNIPYKGPYSMLVTISGDDKFLTKNGLIELISKMTQERVHVKIPKFSYEATYNLYPVISQVNLGNILNGEYRNMVGANTLPISQIIQKVRIEVDEVGTKAAAVTVIGVTSAAPSLTKKEIWFIANIPFNYYIIHSPSKDILFCGRYKGKN